MNYEAKYLRYKNKYFQLKNQMRGGGVNDSKFKLTDCRRDDLVLNDNRDVRSKFTLMNNMVNIQGPNNNFINIDKKLYNEIDVDNNNCRRFVMPDESCKAIFYKTLGDYDPNGIFKVASKFDDICESKKIPADLYYQGENGPRRPRDDVEQYHAEEERRRQLEADKLYHM